MMRVVVALIKYRRLDVIDAIDAIDVGDVVDVVELVDLVGCGGGNGERQRGIDESINCGLIGCRLSDFAQGATRGVGKQRIASRGNCSGTGQLLGGLHQRLTKLGGRETIVWQRATSAFENRCEWAEIGRDRHQFVDARIERCDGGIRSEWDLAGDRLNQDEAQRVNV